MSTFRIEVSGYLTDIVRISSEFQISNTVEIVSELMEIHRIISQDVSFENERRLILWTLGTIRDIISNESSDQKLDQATANIIVTKCNESIEAFRVVDSIGNDEQFNQKARRAYIAGLYVVRLELEQLNSQDISSGNKRNQNSPHPHSNSSSKKMRFG